MIKKNQSIKLFMLVLCLGLIMMTQPVIAKSVYVIADIRGNPTPIMSYDVQPGPSYLVYQATYGVPDWAMGAVGLAIDTESEMLFITYEGSRIIQLVDAKTMTDEGTVTAPGANNLAGVVVDQDKQKVYTIDRNTNNLYVYSWNATTKTLTLDLQRDIEGVIGAHGLALDEVHDLLYVAGNVTANNIHVYSTADWSLTATYTAHDVALGIAVDVQNGFIYTGGAGYYGKKLCKYDMNTDIATSVDVISLTGNSADGAVGLAVDPISSLLYVTTGNQASGGTDCILVIDSDLNLLYQTVRIGNPTGICIPGKDVKYNPLNLAKNDVVQGIGVPIGQNFTYELTSENTNAYDVTDVTLVDQMPVELDFITEYVDGVEGTGVYDPVTHTVSWELGTMVAGAAGPLVELIVLINDQAVAGETIYNLATIESNETPPTTDIGEDPDCDTCDPGTIVIQPTFTCYPELPAPELAFERCEAYDNDGHLGTYYFLDVTNWAAYPDELFEAVSDLGPCGLNTNPSRSWVHIYRADGSRIYGFCALGVSATLQDIWFGIPQGDVTPEEVYIEIYDRGCDLTYTSNLIQLGGSDITGYATADGAGLHGVMVELMGGGGTPINSAVTDENGYYEFIEIGNGSYTVSITPPLGFVSEEAVKEVGLACASQEVNFELQEIEIADGVFHCWWWKKQFLLQTMTGVHPSHIHITPEDVTHYNELIFDHFYSRTDEFAIRLETITYMGSPARPITYEEMSALFLAPYVDSYEFRFNRSLRTNLLNIASGRMSQTKIVSADGATASQAITYLVGLFQTGERKNMYYADVFLQFMHAGWVIPAGYIDLTTPNIMFKDGDDITVSLPSEFSLSQNYPNPFNPTTEISFSLSTAGNVSLDIFNITGQKITTLASSYYEAGRHIVTWDARTSASGIYFYRLQVGNLVETKKMVLLK